MYDLHQMSQKSKTQTLLKKNKTWTTHKICCAQHAHKETPFSVKTIEASLKHVISH